MVMNPRQRFRAVVRFKKPDYYPILSCDAIDGPNMYTVRTWQREQGFPLWVDSPQRWDEFWGMNRIVVWQPASEVEPMPKPDVVKRDNTYETLRYADGRVIRQWIGQTATNFYGMPQFIEFPCHNRDDWEVYRDRWAPMEQGVYPDNWSELVDEWARRKYPLGTTMPGSFGLLRSLFGTKQACRLFYTDPELVHDILLHYRRRAMKMLKKLVTDVELDFVVAWEDFCYRSGCLVSPRIFREFIIPHYREQTRFAQKHGIPLFLIDSDGYVEDIISLLEEAGVNGLQAFEVRAGNNILRVAENHPDFVIWGGLDKFAMDSEKTYLADQELEQKVYPLVERSGYFPGIDHGLPPSSHWRTYLHFMDRLHKICNNPEGKFREYL